MSAADPQAASSWRAGPGWWAAAAAVAAVGAWLRLRGVADLHLILDERLVLRSLAPESLLDAFTQHTLADRSTAVTLFAQLLYRAGALDELSLRLPMLVSGLLLLGLPIAFRRLGPPTALVYLALLAGSAPLVYFSFVARPYAPALLAIGVAFAAWDRWCRTDGRAAAAVFGVAAGIATFLHVFAAPVVAAFFAVGLYEAARGRRPWGSWWRSVAWAAGSAALLIGPGAIRFVSVHGVKLGVGQLSADLPVAIFQRLAGGLAGTPWLLALATAIGLAHWLRRDPRLGVAGCLVLAFPAIALALRQRRAQVALTLWVAGAAAFLLWTRPGEHAEPPGRLAAGVAPLFSWGVAAVLAAGVVGRLTTRDTGTACVAALILSGTIGLSPLRLYRQLPDSFRSHPQALLPLTAAEAPAFYRRLARGPDAGGVLLECPDPDNLIHSAPYARYQQTHRRRVVLLSPIAQSFRRGFRNLVDVADADAVGRSGARYALVHRNIAAEIFGADSAPMARFDAHAKACREALRAHWGPPVYSDDVLEAFDLRASGRSAPGGMR